MMQLELDLASARQQYEDKPSYDTALTVQLVERELQNKRDALYRRWGRFVTRPATTRDAYEVSHDLAEVSEADLRDLSTWQFLKQVRALGTQDMVSIYDDGPIAVMGFIPGKDYTDMWFLGTTRYFDGSAPIILASRRMIRHFRDQCFDAPIRCLTHSRHPQVERWYYALGFVQHPSPVAGTRLFIL